MPPVFMSGLALSSLTLLGTIAVGGMRASAEKTRQLLAYQTGAPLPLDGDLKKWQGADSVTFEGSPLGGHPRRATVYALWDSANLYLAFDVLSSKLQGQVCEHDGDKLWEDDGAEFLIDAHRDRTKAYLPDDFAYHLNILNVVFDDQGTPSGQPDPKWDGSARHIVKIVDAYHYIIEVAIPWAEIGVQSQANHTTLGIDFCVNGKDPRTGEYDYFDWCGLKVFHDPSGFGDLYRAT